MSLYPQRSEHSLSDDRTDFARRSGKTVRSRAVSRWEALSRDDESRGVRSEVEEELAQHVKGEEGAVTEMVVGETDDNEQNSEHCETHELNGLASDGVDGSTATYQQVSSSETRLTYTVTQYPGMAPAQTMIRLPTAAL